MPGNPQEPRCNRKNGLKSSAANIKKNPFYFRQNADFFRGSPTREKASGGGSSKVSKKRVLN
jgi:hypothetical protein